MNDVRAAAETDNVIARAADERIIGVAVFSLRADQIIACAAVDKRVRGTVDERVIARAAVDCCMLRAIVDGIGSVAAVEQRARPVDVVLNGIVTRAAVDRRARSVVGEKIVAVGAARFGRIVGIGVGVSVSVSVGVVDGVINGEIVAFEFEVAPRRIEQRHRAGIARALKIDDHIIADGQE